MTNPSQAHAVKFCRIKSELHKSARRIPCQISDDFGFVIVRLTLADDTAGRSPGTALEFGA